jgi:hypothetical protein
VAAVLIMILRKPLIVQNVIKRILYVIAAILNILNVNIHVPVVKDLYAVSVDPI